MNVRVFVSTMFVFVVKATREALLSRSPEFKEARLHTFHNSTAVYDLLTIALVKRAQFHTLSEVRKINPHLFCNCLL